jgi:hypothetical protein
LTVSKKLEAAQEAARKASDKAKAVERVEMLKHYAKRFSREVHAGDFEEAQATLLEINGLMGGDEPQKESK